MSAADLAQPGAPDHPAGALTQTALLTRRLFIRTLRQPVVSLLNLVISAFFLFVYDGAFGHSSAVRLLAGGNYANFILPVAILFAAISGGAAGFTLVTDIQEGYFARQLTMPLARSSIVGAAIALGALWVLIQAGVIVALGFVIGASPRSGALGVLVVMGFALLWGLGFAGYSVATGLLTGDAQAAQAATFIFFPVMFLAPIFLPKAQLAGWIQAIATINPTTYVLDALRSLMVHGWQLTPLVKGLVAGVAFAAITLGWGVFVAVRKTSRA